MGFFDKLFGTEEDDATIASEMQRMAGEQPGQESAVDPSSPSKKNGQAVAGTSGKPEPKHSPAQSLKQAPHQVGSRVRASQSATGNVPNRNGRGASPPPLPPLDTSASTQAVTTSAKPQPSAEAATTLSSPGLSQSGRLEARRWLESTLVGVGPVSAPVSSKRRETPLKAARQSTSTRVQPPRRKQEDTLPGLAKAPDRQAEFESQLSEHGALVREYLVCAGLGPVSADWAGSVSIALGHLRNAARAAGRKRELRLMAQASEAIATFSLADSKFVRLLEGLSDVLPGKSIHKEIVSRELLLVDNLVRLVPEVRKPAVERLKQGSLWSLRTLQQLELTEAAELSGVDGKHLARIRDLVNEHLERRKAWHPVPRSQVFKQSLRETLNALERFDREFEQADREDDRETKRQAREARRQAAHRVNVMLVESGELDTLATVERMSVADKITHLRVANGEG